MSSLPVRIPLAAFGFVFTVLCGVLSLLLLGLGAEEQRTAQALADAGRRQDESYQAALQLAQTVNDFTRMARLYVATGNPLYERYYRRMLDIRNGSAPRPVDYDGFYWDRVLAGSEALDRSSPPKPLQQWLDEKNFTRDEQAVLEAVRAESDRLASMELAAVNAVHVKMVSRAVGAAMPATAAEQESLSGPAYLHDRGRVMAAIQDCATRVERRGTTLSAGLTAWGERLRRWMLMVAAALLATLMLSAFVLRRLVQRPLQGIADVARAVEQRDFRRRVPAQRATEIARIADAFNLMVDDVRNGGLHRARLEEELRAAQAAAAIGRLAGRDETGDDTKGPDITPPSTLEPFRLQAPPSLAPPSVLVSAPPAAAAAALADGREVHETSTPDRSGAGGSASTAPPAAAQTSAPVEARPSPATDGPPPATADAAAEAQAIELPDALPGIDLVQGLLRVDGDRREYARTLLRFAREHAGTLHTIATAVAAGRREQACSLAQTLKSDAGRIGAESLQEAARALEFALQTNMPDWAHLSAAAAWPLRTVIEGIDRLQSRPGGSDSTRRTTA